MRWNFRNYASQIRAQWGFNVYKFGEDISSGCISWLEHPTWLLLAEGPERPRDNSAPTVVHIYLVSVTISGPSRSRALRFVDGREAPWELRRVIYKRIGIEDEGGGTNANFKPRELAVPPRPTSHSRNTRRGPHCLRSIYLRRLSAVCRNATFLPRLFHLTLRMWKAGEPDRIARASLIITVSRD